MHAHHRNLITNGGLRFPSRRKASNILCTVRLDLLNKN